MAEIKYQPLFTYTYVRVVCMHESASFDRSMAPDRELKNTPKLVSESVLPPKGDRQPMYVI
jgi:hypothetical protein